MFLSESRASWRTPWNGICLYVNSCVGIPCNIVHPSSKTDTMGDAVVLDISTALIASEWQYIITSAIQMHFSIHWFGPRIFMKTKCNWPLVGKSCKTRHGLDPGRLDGLAGIPHGRVHASSYAQPVVLSFSTVVNTPFSDCLASFGKDKWYKRQARNDLGSNSSTDPLMDAKWIKRPFCSSCTPIPLVFW